MDRRGFKNVEEMNEYMIEKWNGKVPEYYGGEGTDLIFNTGELASEQAEPKQAQTP